MCNTESDEQAATLRDNNQRNFSNTLKKEDDEAYVDQKFKREKKKQDKNKKYKIAIS